MKPSKFNLYLTELFPPGEGMIYNTLSDSSVVVGQELIDLLEPGQRTDQGPDLSEEVIHCLEDLGILVADEVDEDLELEYWFQRIKFNPSVFQLNVLTTYACNLACSYCYQKDLRLTGLMSPVVEQGLLKWLEKKLTSLSPETFQLTFLGGEPLLNKESIIHLAKGIRELVTPKGTALEINIVTNGVLLSEDFISAMLPFGLKEIKVTLDGPPEIHDQRRPLTNGVGSFQNIIENLKSIKGIIPIRIGGNFDSHSIPAIPALLEILAGNGLASAISSLFFKPVLASAAVSEATEAFSSAIPRGATCDFSDIQDIDCYLTFLDWIEEKGMQAEYRIALGPCEACSEWSYTVDPHGHIYKCPALAGHKRFCLGNVGQESLNYANTHFMTLDLWRQDKDCRDCPFLPLCGGGCRSSAVAAQGSLTQRSCNRPYFEGISTVLIQREVLRAEA